MSKKTPKAPTALFRKIVSRFESEKSDYELVQGQLDILLRKLSRQSEDVHSYKVRTKDPLHLLDKLQRRWVKRLTEKREFGVTVDNYSQELNDLVGGRILHLNTFQFESIRDKLENLLDEQQWTVLNDGPQAKVWDPEYHDYFDSLGIRGISQDFYTSVHYECRLPGRPPFRTVEIQVRTLAEELWGETDHRINYPHKTTSGTCAEQIRVLARATSTCTRLVDSIMAAHKEHLS